MKTVTAIVALIAVAAALGLQPGVSRSDSAVTKLPSFDGATGWLNSAPLSPADLKGKVVLVDFWEYTCINCLRTLPYEKAWWQRYSRLGFVIVGVHTPEFAFSGQNANVAAASSRLGVTWPVALDSDLVIWQRYGNDVWPHEYLFDGSGTLVYDYEGEGDYPEMETHIQTLLRAAHPDARFPPPMDILPQDSYVKPGAVCYPQTGEVYVGNQRGDGALANPAGYDPGHVQNYSDPGRHADGSVYLQGPWLSAPQAMVYAKSAGDGSDYIDVMYHALDVVAVLRPEAGTRVKAFVEQDGKPLAHEDAGADVRYDELGRSYVTVDASREYDLVKNRRFGHHDLRIRPLEYGLGVYTFAFESCEVGADR